MRLNAAKLLLLNKLCVSIYKNAIQNCKVVKQNPLPEKKLTFFFHLANQLLNLTVYIITLLSMADVLLLTLKKCIN